MDPIKMLKDDHRKVEKLFARFEKLGERATATQQEIVRKIDHELSLHAALEEVIVYPAMRESMEDMEDDVLEAYEEHHLVKRTLAELRNMTPEDEMFRAKVIVLSEAVEHHVEEEEGELFPKMKKALGKEKLQALGRKLQQAKREATSRMRREAA